MRIRKSFTQNSGTEQGWSWNIPLSINENGSFDSVGETINLIDRKRNGQIYREKINMRESDKKWVYRNIPSSIAWVSEIHHDWKDDGRMYLLTKGEHILRHRKGGVLSL